MSKVIMVQGTMSSVGKSLIVAGLCRIFKQDGYKVCPFKSQNMALNSYITADGLEMGRAQVMQAEAAGIEPDVAMNPILLKPTSDVGSQVIVNGKVIGNMKAREYFEYKKKLVPEIMKAYEKLNKEYDIIVIEGAGSPAEINLKDNDIVNMGMAKLVDAPVILVGDIDRGGVFAQLLGTLMLLEDDERGRVKGLVINKFRGDKSILDSGITMLEKRSNVDVVGVVPYMRLNLEDEDSLTERFEKNNRLEKSDKEQKNIVERIENYVDKNAKSISENHDKNKDIGIIDIAVIKLPHISNFTDFNVLEQTDVVNIHYVTNLCELGRPDMIILPGSKNTIDDMKWLRKTGLETAIKKLACIENSEIDKKDLNGISNAKDVITSGVTIFGICGGYQILGNMINDESGQEEGGQIKGMGLLPVDTYISKEKTCKQIRGKFGNLTGVFEALSGKDYEGYEIHMGVSICEEDMIYDDEMKDKEKTDYINTIDNPVIQNGNIYGTYVHGIFDKGEITSSIIKALADRKNIKLDDIDIRSYGDIKESEFDKLADTLREFMDMDRIYEIMEEK
ncbi:MAG: cobyric acid synthase [Lachnospiraceae bacterium]|nr:cobyric acid synthase [Lachnospiraceae bacterium]